MRDTGSNMKLATPMPVETEERWGRKRVGYRVKKGKRGVGMEWRKEGRKKKSSTVGGAKERREGQEGGKVRN